jgi:hypothetical protein
MPRRDPLELKSLAEVQDATKLSRTKVLAAIAAGELRVVWLGLNPCVPRDELEHYVEELEEERRRAPSGARRVNACAHVDERQD